METCLEGKDGGEKGGNENAPYDDMEIYAEEMWNPSKSQTAPLNPPSLTNIHNLPDVKYTQRAR